MNSHQESEKMGDHKSKMGSCKQCGKKMKRFREKRVKAKKESVVVSNRVGEEKWRVEMIEGGEDRGKGTVEDGEWRGAGRKGW